MWFQLKGDLVVSSQEGSRCGATSQESPHWERRKRDRMQEEEEELELIKQERDEMRQTVLSLRLQLETGLLEMPCMSTETHCQQMAKRHPLQAYPVMNRA